MYFQDTRHQMIWNLLYTIGWNQEECQAGKIFSQKFSSFEHSLANKWKLAVKIVVQLCIVYKLGVVAG